MTRIRGLRPYTAHTTTSPDRFRRALAVTRLTHVAVTRYEHEARSCGVAMPVVVRGSRTSHTVLSSGDRRPLTVGMIVAVSLRLLYLLFLQVLRLPAAATGGSTPTAGPRRRVGRVDHPSRDGWPQQRRARAAPRPAAAGIVAEAARPAKAAERRWPAR